MSELGPLPEPEVLVKKIKAKGHGGHHGGAWKVAYADFVTAMMAFFLLMWLLGATDDVKRQGIADYFSPTTAITSDQSGGANGIMGGRSVTESEGAAAHAQKAIIRMDTVNPLQKGAQQSLDQIEAALKQKIQEKLAQDPALQGMEKMLKFSQTPDGLRIELIDDADYSMFLTGSAAIDPRAAKLLNAVGEAIRPLPNRLAIRGHTDAVPYSGRNGLSNNWTLSASRADITRQLLVAAGVGEARVARLEGVADTEPHITADPFDPRNRRMSVTLLNLQ